MRVLSLAPLFLWACASTSAPITAATKAETNLVTPAKVEARASKTFSSDLFEMIDTVALAVEAKSQGETTEALDLFHKAWIADPANPHIIEEYAQLALRLGNPAAALMAYKNIDVDFETASPALIANYVLAEIANGKAQDVELSLNLALEKNLEDPRLWNALGHYYDGQGLHLRAQDSYLKALETGSGEASIINNLGMSLLMQGQRQAALEKFQQAAELAPMNALFDNNRRLVLALQSDYHAATQGLSDVRAADLLNDAGYIAKQRKDRKRAKQLFERSIAVSPRHHPKAAANLKSLKNG